jgi:hypothetical protein
MAAKMWIVVFYPEYEGDRFLRNGDFLHNSDGYNPLHAVAIFSLEDGDSMFLRDIRIHLQAHSVLLPRRPISTSSPPWEPQVAGIITCFRLFLEQIEQKQNIFANRVYASEPETVDRCDPENPPPHSLQSPEVLLMTAQLQIRQSSYR